MAAEDLADKYLPVTVVGPQRKLTSAILALIPYAEKANGDPEKPYAVLTWQDGLFVSGLRIVGVPGQVNFTIGEDLQVQTVHWENTQLPYPNGPLHADQVGLAMLSAARNLADYVKILEKS